MNEEEAKRIKYTTEGVMCQNHFGVKTQCCHQLEKAKILENMLEKFLSIDPLDKTITFWGFVHLVEKALEEWRKVK